MKSGPDLTGWVTKAELMGQLAADGVKIGERQLERLGNRGLLLPRPYQQSDPRMGSVVWYPPGAFDQVREARSIRPYRFKQVGWELWSRGYEVDEKWWRPEVDAAAHRMALAIQFLSPFFDPAEHQDFGDVGAVVRAAPTAPIAQPYWERFFGSLESGQQAQALCTIMEVALGNHSAFADDDEKDPITATEDIGVRLLGAGSGELHSVLGKSMNIRELLGPIFHAMSDKSNSGSFEDRYRRLSVSELQAAATEVRQAFNIARNMHEALRWIYGPNAMGLGLASWLADHGPRWAKATWIIGWAELRGIPGMALPPEQIAELERKSVELLNLSKALQQLSKQPKFRNVITGKRIKHAYLNHDNLSDYRKELARAAKSK